MNLLWLVPVSGLCSLALAGLLIFRVLRLPEGPPEMRAVGKAIQEGATAFLTRQYGTIIALSLPAAAIVTILIGLFEKTSETGIVGWQLGWRTGVAFLVGAAASMISGVIGMWVAVKSNTRTANAARRGMGPALEVALQGGAVSGLLVVGLSLMAVYVMVIAYGGLTPEGVHQAPFLVVGMGFGASFVALFAQLGGGIYTKAADVGADLVGKVEAGIPEDDPRNAAVIADLVGDNVGDCAGRGADLFESTVAENIGAMILGVGLAVATGRAEWVFFPLVVRAAGLIASAVGIFLTKHRGNEEPMTPLFRGYLISVGLSVVALYFIVHTLLRSNWFFLAGVIGLAMSVAFVWITMYYTEGRWRPVRSITRASLRGVGPNIITGLAVGLENTAAPVLVIVAAVMGSYACGREAAATLGVAASTGGIFGTAVATMGMLMTCAYILAMDTFGPIVDNAGGIAEMSKAPADVRRGTDALDAAGNTTKALTKGYAIGSAALAAFLLFSAYIDKVRLVQKKAGLPLMEHVDLGKVEVFSGALIGIMLIFFFSSLAIRAVSVVAEQVIEEVRRQFRTIPGLLEGKGQAEYGKCVDITARGALKAMVLPGIVAVACPILVGIILRAEAVAATLMAGTMAGIVLATFFNNGGGAWDNAKKFVEAGKLVDDAGQVHGKKSEAHRAAVVGDTVGDPLKDTAGPSLHVVIKLLATVTLVLAALFV
jgi:K(+)-stimulated pyrophosphate-energized sodium pump